MARVQVVKVGRDQIMKGSVRHVENCPKGNEKPLRGSKQILKIKYLFPKDPLDTRWRMDWRNKTGVGKLLGGSYSNMEIHVLFKRCAVAEPVGLGHCCHVEDREERS